MVLYLKEKLPKVYFVPVLNRMVSFCSTSF